LLSCISPGFPEKESLLESHLSHCSLTSLSCAFPMAKPQDTFLVAKSSSFLPNYFAVFVFSSLYLQNLIPYKVNSKCFIFVE
jgi:hypothetical protein